jgi:hypothetical protein
LCPRVADTGDRAVGERGGGAGDVDHIPDADGAGVADDGLPGGSGGVVRAHHHSIALRVTLLRQLAGAGRRTVNLPEQRTFGLDGGDADDAHSDARLGGDHYWSDRSAA